MKINKEGYIIIGTTGAIFLAIWLLVYFLIDTQSLYQWIEQLIQAFTLFFYNQ